MTVADLPTAQDPAGPVPGASAFHTVVDPRTGTPIQRVELLPGDRVPEVARAAHAAFPSWADIPIERRCHLLTRLADALAARAPETALALSREHGKTVDEASAELGRAVETLRWAAAAGPRAVRPKALADRAGLARAVHVEPAGPVLAIVPWNYPAVVLARKLGPALVMGCPVVVKGPEQTPQVLAAFSAAVAEAGLPAGVVQFVVAAPAQTQALVERPEFRQITFTGSDRVGRLLAGTAAHNLTQCTLELGGHAPVIVTADADLDLATSALTAAKFASAGQSCGAPSRFLVAHSVYEALVDRLVRSAPGLDNGPTTGPAMGPLNSDRQRRSVHALVLDAVERGADLRLGGVLPTGPGFYYAATILADVPLDARIMREEPFGPVAAVRSYTDEEEAIAIANNTDYALSAYVFGPVARAHAIGDRLNAGSISINSVPGAAPDAPLGGRLASGYGYEGGEDGLLAFARLKIRQHPPESAAPAAGTR